MSDNLLVAKVETLVKYFELKNPEFASTIKDLITHEVIVVVEAFYQKNTGRNEISNTGKITFTFPKLGEGNIFEIVVGQGALVSDSYKGQIGSYGEINHTESFVYFLPVCAIQKLINLKGVGVKFAAMFNERSVEELIKQNPYKLIQELGIFLKVGKVVKSTKDYLNKVESNFPIFTNAEKVRKMAEPTNPINTFGEIPKIRIAPGFEGLFSSEVKQKQDSVDDLIKKSREGLGKKRLALEEKPKVSQNKIPERPFPDFSNKKDIEQFNKLPDTVQDEVLKEKFKSVAGSSPKPLPVKQVNTFPDFNGPGYYQNKFFDENPSFNPHDPGFIKKDEELARKLYKDEFNSIFDNHLALDDDDEVLRIMEEEEDINRIFGGKHF